MKPRTLLATVLIAALAGLAQAAAPGALSGEVLEVRNVESYTYLRLKTATGEIWAAVPTSAVSKGARVSIARPMVMKNFESKTLNKRFDEIVFGSLDAPNPGGPATAAPMPKTPSAATALAVVKVDKAKAPNAKTVAEIVAGRSTLKDQTVVVRAQVVKFSGGIMGKNWVHLRDGSGKAADGNDDLLVTTQDTAAVGDIVQATGKVRVDVKFGAGYDYAVLIDGATLSK